MGANTLGRPGGLAPAVGISITVFFSAADLRADDFRDWRDTSHVFINTSASGANVATTLIGFPLLVRLDRAKGFDFSRARALGQDIRFSKPDGTPLPHHIERWDSAAGKAELWVMVDTLRGNNATQYIRLHSANPAAADASNPAAVFPASKGLVGVWHLGAAGTGGRANAVPGGLPAAPVNYDGDEARPGIIGLCDSLDGAAAGDYLDIGDGYADFSGGFSWSAWMLPSAVRKWSHVLDLGNPVGPAPDFRGQDNIVVGREDMTDNLITHLYLQGGAHSPLHVEGIITNGQWQHFTVTISNADSTVRTYKNGALVGTARMAAPLSVAHRVNNWLGRSAWSADEYFQGKLDEVRLSKVAHSAAWIRLGYESQRPDQIMVTFAAPPRCQSRFAVPAGQTVSEGASLTLTGTADCAEEYAWSAVSGPAPRIHDPNVKALQFAAPRVAGDTLLVYRFTARFGDSARTGEVRLTVREAIPEPLFTLPAALAWSGRDSLAVTPTVTNLAAVRASRDSIIRYAWTVEGLELDTAVGKSSLLLKGPAPSGTAKVGLCLDNGGPRTCRTVAVTVGATSFLGPVAAPARMLPAAETPRRAADGRLVPPGSRARKAFPVRP